MNSVSPPLHISVLEREVVSVFQSVPLKKFVDGTVGLGGHTAAVISAHAHEIESVYCFDQDQEAIFRAKKRLEELPGRKFFINQNTAFIQKELARLNVHKVDGILFDLGISSLQLNHSERGFSFLSHHEMLDMRMDISSVKTAFDVVQFYSEKELYRVFNLHSDLKNIRLVVKKIVEARNKEAIKTVGQLSAVFNHGKIFGISRKHSNPLFQIFQAIRMEVNQELKSLEEMLRAGFELLAHDGIMAVISFHSIEDRVVKQMFQQWERPMESHPAFPGGIPALNSFGHNVFKKPVLPSVEEVSMNPRSRSAKLRAFRRVLNAS